jgi:flagella basal body P-ring formation protein FlgA
LRKLIFLTLLLISDLISDYQLQDNYVFNSNIVKSRDLFPSIDRNFFIHRVKSSKDKFYLSSVHLIDIFRKNGYRVVNGNRVRNVKFIRVSKGVCLECIESKLEEAFTSKYPDLRIDSLRIFPKEPISKLPNNYRINFSASSLKKASGYFYIVDSGRNRTYFKYRVNGYLPVVKSFQSIKKGEMITFENSYPTEIEFNRIYSGYISEKQIGSVKAKRFLLKNSAITDRDVNVLPAIKRGQRVKASLKDGGITVIVEATALRDGAIGEMIYIKTYDGVRLRATVLSEKSVEIF